MPLRALPVVLLLALCLAPAASAQAPSPLNLPMMPSVATEAERFTVEETPAGLLLKTARYTLEIGREGYDVTVRRGGETVLATPRGAGLEWTVGGAVHRAAALAAYERVGDRLVLEYAATHPGTTVRVEMAPRAGYVQVAARVLNASGSYWPWVRHELAPSGKWYGGGFQGWRSPQVIPLNNARIQSEGFLQNGATQGTPIWYATRGVGVWVRTPMDFAYSINALTPGGAPDGLLSFRVPEASSVTYDLIIADDIRGVVRRLIDAVGYPAATPPQAFFRGTIYTTWVEFKTDINQEKVLAYARAIKSNDLPCAVIEIDDLWEHRYGDLEFNPERFPDPKAMVDELHRMGFRVTLWVHPFVAPESRTFADHGARGWLLRDRSGNVGLINWWNGVSAVRDFTRPEAAAAFREQLQALQRQTGLDGFKFDGGDEHLVPQDLQAAVDITPFQYADIYNREAAAHFDWNETRVGVYSQPLGVVMRLIDKHSVWSNENGLGALIPEGVTNSLRGYPYLMPDMVGGNQYDDDRIDAELLVRWAQASALFPFFQYSVGPWHYGAEAVRLCREASRLHERFTPYVYALAEQARRTGEPILRPLWYNAPQEAETLEITDQFMLGEDVVVAPVLAKGARTRDVYLPEGAWRDETTGKRVEGGRWLRGYAAPLDVLPLFVREGSEAGRTSSK